MDLWLIVQFAYALFAWTLAARAVYRATWLGTCSGRGLADIVRDLRRAGRTADLPKLAAHFDDTPVAALLESATPSSTVDELLHEAERVLDAIRPPGRLLRTLPTVGTSLGLLAAIATLRGSLNTSTAVGMELAATRAFESAAIGFLTALPCWTAGALVSRWVLRANRELDLVVLRLSAASDSAADAEGDDPVDDAEESRSS